MTTEERIRTFETSGGGQIFQIALEEFPGLWGYVYLVFVEEYRVLIDTGSGFGVSNQQLEKGLQTVQETLNQPFGWNDLTHILITHGHIDHIGGLTYIRPLTAAKLGVHELDRRILTNHAERLLVVSRRVQEFLTEAGVAQEQQKNLLELYRFTKSLFHSIPVDFTFEAVGMQVGPFEMLHVPGHCAGHVVIRLHDVLFSGDHILADTSPHQSPEHLTLSTGLDHYLKSLEILRRWAGDIPLTLGGHKQLILDLNKRIHEIETLHHQRLQQVLDILQSPHTIAEVSFALFRDVSGYNVLLALEEAGAHVEYLYQRGQLEIANLAELERSEGSVAIQYQCVECDL